MVLNSKVVLEYYLPHNGDEVAVSFPVKKEFQYLSSHELWKLGPDCVDQACLNSGQKEEFQKVADHRELMKEIGAERPII